jgi:hypothetical protein
VNSELEILGARKQLLVARASLQRLKAAQAVEALHESLRWPRPAVALVTSPRAFSVIAALLLLVLARRRVGRAARWASVALALLRIFRGGSRAP